MSDDPADSLRRELDLLRTQFVRRLIEFRGYSITGAEFSVDAIWPLVESALAAARADERERLEQENRQLRERLEAIRRDPTLALVTNVKPLKVVFEDGN